MYQNSVFTVISPTTEDIVTSSEEFIDKLGAMPDREATIIFSCIVRRMSFGADPLTEARIAESKLSGLPPFMFAYAGGEICPTSVRDGSAVNRFHNYSIIACVL
jgi:hypothetical protein